MVAEGGNNFYRKLKDRRIEDPRKSMRCAAPDCRGKGNGAYPSMGVRQHRPRKKFEILCSNTWIFLHDFGLRFAVLVTLRLTYTPAEKLHFNTT